MAKSQPKPINYRTVNPYTWMRRKYFIEKNREKYLAKISGIVGKGLPPLPIGGIQPMSLRDLKALSKPWT